jgi:hypothetical protein
VLQVREVVAMEEAEDAEDDNDPAVKALSY